VASWNLENLFRPAADADAARRQVYQDKLDWLAAAINGLAPDVLAVQEVGDAAAVEDLRELLDGDWHVDLSPDGDRRGIRVGILSRLSLSDVQRVRAFPAGTVPVQLDDDGTTSAQMGRGALLVRVSVDATAVDLVTCHLKSKLLSYPGDRFNPRDGGRTRALRRLRARTASGGGHHAERRRHRAAGWPGPAARRDRARRPQRRAAGRHHSDPARAAWLGDRHTRLRPRR
jgi:hypothetical protein